MCRAIAKEDLFRTSKDPSTAARTRSGSSNAPAAEDPSLDEIGMHVARLFDREVALIDRAEALGAEAHLLVEREAREELGHALVRLVVERDVDAVTVEDGEADLTQRLAELCGEGAFPAFIAVQEAADVAGADLELVIELLVIR